MTFPWVDWGNKTMNLTIINLYFPFKKEGNVRFPSISHPSNPSDNDFNCIVPYRVIRNMPHIHRISQLIHLIMYMYFDFESLMSFWCLLTLNISIVSIHKLLKVLGLLLIRLISLFLFDACECDYSISNGSYLSLYFMGNSVG